MSTPTTAMREDIVLVDDDPMVAEFVARVLRRSGRTLCVFEDPLAALDHLLRARARTLIVDTRMPGLSGVELLERLLAAGRLEGTRVFLCSAARVARADETADALPGIERIGKDALLDRRTLLERLGGGDAPRKAV